MARESSPPDKSGNRPAICPVVMHQAYGCVVAKDYSFPEEKNSLSRSQPLCGTNSR